MAEELGRYLSEFDDCFGRSEPREHLHEYVCGQASELHRKSLEPIAMLNGTPPRTLQRFRIKDGQKSPIVWEITHAPFRRKRQDGLPAQAGTLIVARNVFTGEIKYFISSMAVGRAGRDATCVLPATEPPRQAVSHQENPQDPEEDRYDPRPIQVVRAL